jgi:hypothetical protein
MVDQTLANDIDTVARAEIIAYIQYGLDSGELSHESCPDVGASDWTLIVDRIRSIMSDMSPDDFDRAESYARLIERVDTVDD